MVALTLFSFLLLPPPSRRYALNQVVGDRDLKQEIETLIKAKEQGAELDYGPRIPAIGDFIDREIARLENQQFTDGTQNGSAEELNRLFRSALDEVWS
jgi:predicted nucleotidyltransferase